MRIPVSHGHLEALYRTTEEPIRGAAVVCHPHPLHGGTMHTKAVFRAAQALEEVGFHVVRFNFRGVGTSTGSFGDAVGEEEDVEAALDWLEGEAPGLPLLVGGFSFGSRVGFSVGAREERVQGMLGIGLPVSMYDYGFLDGVEKPILIVQGENDEFGGPDALREALDGVDAPITLEAIAGSDHFFHEHVEELKATVREYFTRGPGGEAFPVRDSG